MEGVVVRLGPDDSGVATHDNATDDARKLLSKVILTWLDIDSTDRKPIATAETLAEPFDANCTNNDRWVVPCVDASEGGSVSRWREGATVLACLHLKQLGTDGLLGQVARQNGMPPPCP